VTHPYQLEFYLLLLSLPKRFRLTSPNLTAMLSKCDAPQMAWNSNCAVLFERLEKILSKKKYKKFIGDFRTYHLTRKGQSCLYDIPANQLGFLKPYRGKRVRLVCRGAWDQYGRKHYSVAVVPKRIHDNVVQLHQTESN
jgi:hypothetical protein